MMQHVLQSLESANVISEYLRIIVKFLMSSTVNSALCEGIEGLCMLFRRLSYLCRYGDMAKT